MTTSEPPLFSPFAAYITEKIEKSDKTQIEIAHELGYDKPNIITMFKHGATKVPVAKVPALARALGLDPAHLLRLALSEYSPEILEAIESSFGWLVAEDEYQLLKQVRTLTGGDPAAMKGEPKPYVAVVNLVPLAGAGGAS